nr:hypothetical protein [uncultured Porphyromonas sp.]
MGAIGAIGLIATAPTLRRLALPSDSTYPASPSSDPATAPTLHRLALPSDSTHPASPGSA